MHIRETIATPSSVDSVRNDNAHRAILMEDQPILVKMRSICWRTLACVQVILNHYKLLRAVWRHMSRNHLSCRYQRSSTNACHTYWGSVNKLESPAQPALRLVEIPFPRMLFGIKLQGRCNNKFDMFHFSENKSKSSGRHGVSDILGQSHNLHANKPENTQTKSTNQ